MLGLVDIWRWKCENVHQILLNDGFGLGNLVCRQRISLQPQFFCFSFDYCNQWMYLNDKKKCFWLLSLHLGIRSNINVVKVMLVPKGAGLMHDVQQFHWNFPCFPQFVAWQKWVHCTTIAAKIDETPLIMPASRLHMLQRILMASWLWEDKKAWSFSKP